MRRAQNEEPGLSNGQKAILHVAAGQIGMGDETYRDTLERFAGVRSSIDMDQDGFLKVMRHFEKCGFKAQGAERRARAENKYKSYYEKWMDQLGNRAGMGSVGQLALIETLWDDLEWYWNKNGQGSRAKSLAGFLLGRFGVKKLAWLEFKTAGKVIEAMKAIAQRAERKAQSEKG